MLNRSSDRTCWNFLQTHGWTIWKNQCYNFHIYKLGSQVSASWFNIFLTKKWNQCPLGRLQSFGQVSTILFVCLSVSKITPSPPSSKRILMKCSGNLIMGRGTDDYILVMFLKDSCTREWASWWRSALVISFYWDTNILEPVEGVYSHLGQLLLAGKR